MKITVTQMRRRPMEVIQALDLGETVTLLYRGKEKGIIYPARSKRRRFKSFKDHPACGMWKDREDMKDVEAWLRKRRTRHLPRITP